ncbi:MAG: ornithine carbamoyltransferase [Ktedonobacterales bacterium]
MMNSLVTLDGLAPADIEQLFLHARLLKRLRGRTGPQPQPLARRTVALLFEKPSLRTRVSFEVGAGELGGRSLSLSPQEVGLGARESVADVARVLSGYVHVVVLRTFSHRTVEEFARHATIPVINGLSDLHHPCQGLTDLFTIAERFGALSGLTLAYVGDGNNVAHSLVQAAVKMGVSVRIATPRGYEPDATILASATAEAAKTGASVAVTNDPASAVADAQIVYTDVWTSMGQEAEVALRRAVFAGYQVNRRLLALAAPDAIVMHPLPAHRGEEITDEALDGSQAAVFTQAENRLHVQKAILSALVASQVSIGIAV